MDLNDTSGLTTLLLLVPLLPLAGAALNALVGRKLGHTASGMLATAAVGASFVLSLVLFARMSALPEESREILVHLADWIQVGSLSLQWSLLLDPLSMVYILFVSGVATLIHLYSIGYMKGDTGFARYFAYLNLFCFSMLTLVLGGNLLVTFLGWEGVGLCSYLLIGFWFEDKAKASAGKKAFIVNRIGDFGFLLAMFFLFTHLHVLEYPAINEAIAHYRLGHWLPTAVALLLFLGATGKSAQIPLYVWLPDAMAGPTPVSALIHAATMVTAGLYLLARTHVIFLLAPAAMTTVAVVGALTALLAATIALTQYDIKKVLAYSTVSQLGYMFLAMGVGAFGTGLFHVVTHAFFKALLFLGAGAVIHAMHHVYHEVNDHGRDPQDMRNMGGLRCKLPVTYWSFLAGTLAISGIPPFAGFFSKDEILWQTFARGHFVLYAIGLITAALTSFYMFRLLILTFWGKHRGKAGEEKHLHENPLVMTLPLMVLAVLSTIAGFWGLPHILDFGHLGNRFESWLEPVFAHAPHAHAAHGSVALEWTLMLLSVLVAVAAIWMAWRRYAQKQPRLEVATRGAKAWSYHKWYVDELYEAAVIRPLHQLCTVCWKAIDVAVIDGAVNGTAALCSRLGRVTRLTQTGSLPVYLTVMALGAALALAWICCF